MDFVQGLHQDFEKCVASIGECFFDFNNADGTSSPSKANEAWASIKLKLHSFIQHGDDVIESYFKNSQNVIPNKPLSEREPEGEEREFCPLDNVLPGENFQHENNDLSLEQTLPATNSENEKNVSFLVKSLTTLCELIKNKDTEETVIDIMANILNEAQPKGNFKPKDLTREQIENIESNVTILCTFIDDESGQAEAEKIKTELFSFIEKERETDLTSAISETATEFNNFRNSQNTVFVNSLSGRQIIVCGGFSTFKNGVETLRDLVYDNNLQGTASSVSKDILNNASNAFEPNGDLIPGNLTQQQFKLLEENLSSLCGYIGESYGDKVDILKSMLLFFMKGETSASNLEESILELSQDWSKKFNSQAGFIKNVLKMNIVECGGGGDCLAYSIVSQVKKYHDLGQTEGVKKFRQDVSTYAGEKSKEYSVYKIDLEQKLKIAQSRIHEQLSPEEQKKCEADIGQYTALLKDAEKDEQAIRDLSTLHQTLDACGYEVKWMAKYLNRTIHVFSEYDPHSREGVIGTYFSYFPDGSITPNRYIDSFGFSANDIFIYHIGNDKGGHYQAITKLKS